MTPKLVVGFLREYIRDQDVTITQDAASEYGFVLCRGARMAQVRVSERLAEHSVGQAMEQLVRDVDHVIWAWGLGSGMVVGRCGKWRMFSRRP